MHLSKEDAKFFFHLMWSWQLFVNREKHVIPELMNIDAFQNITTDQIFLVQKACYDNPKLLDKYLKLNPDNFNAEQLAVISQWKKPIRGKFQIERYLTNHAIFISDDDKVYAVSGLTDGFDTIIHKSNLPCLIETALLPFKGKVVYDGLLRPYNVHFGGGIKSSLKEIYMRAKQNDKIISSFDKKPKSTKKIVYKDYTSEIEALKEIAKPLRGSATQAPLNAPTFSLLKAAIELSETSLEQKVDIDDAYKALGKLDRARNKLLATLKRME